MATSAEVERMVVRLVGDATSLQAALASSRTSMTTTTKVFQMAGAKLAIVAAKVKAVGMAMATTGRAMRSAGMMMSMAVTAPLAIMGSMATKAFAKFDNAMIESTSIMDATGAEINKMKQTALDLSTGGAIKQGPAELAKSYFYLASAGKNAAQSMKLLPAVAKFATAGAFDMSLATDLLTDAQSALGLSSKDVIQDEKNMIRLSDALVKANTLANASVEQFSKALTSGAGSALKTYNKSVEEGLALLSAMADQGIKAELAGNALNRIQRLLIQSNQKNAKAHEKFGFSVFTAAGKMRNYADIIKQLEGILKGMTDQQKAATLDALGFKARVQGVILPLLGTSDAIAEYQKKLEKAGGVTAGVAAKQMASFSNQMKVMKNRMTAIGIEIGEVLGPMLQKLTGWLGVVIEKWKALSPRIKKIIVIVGIVVSAIGPLLMIGGMLISSIGAIISGTIAFFVAIKAVVVGIIAAISATSGLIIPIVLVAAAIAAAIAVMVPWKKMWKVVWGAVKKFVVNAIGFIMHFTENMKILWDWLQTNWKSLLINMLDALVQFHLNMITNAGVALKMAMRLFVAFQGWMAGLWNRIFSVEFLKAVWNGIKVVGKILLQFAKKAWETIKSIFSGEDPGLDSFMSQIKDDFNKGAKDINFLNTAADIIKDESKNFVSPLKDVTSAIEGPKFNLGFGGVEEKAVEEAVKNGKKVSKKVVKEAGAAEAIKATVEYDVKGIDAVEAGSAEAMARVREFMSMKTTKDISEDAKQTTQASLSAQMADQESKKAAALEEQTGWKQQSWPSGKAKTEGGSDASAAMAAAKRYDTTSAGVDTAIAETKKETKSAGLQIKKLPKGTPAEMRWEGGGPDPASKKLLAETASTPVSAKPTPVSAAMDKDSPLNDIKVGIERLVEIAEVEAKVQKVTVSPSGL